MFRIPNLVGLILLISLIFTSFDTIEAQRKRKKDSKKSVAIASELFSSLEYRLIGPFRGGRSAAVTGVANQPQLFYFGATGGGVWKTEDGGSTWQNISDGFFGGSIGAVEVSKSDPNIIFVGGGEKTLRGNVSSGYGIWRSEDAGKTWVSSGLPKSRHIPRIRIHPTNPDIVYAGVLGNIYKATEERGLYKSTDGGKTWNKILYSNDMAGIVDLIIDPLNPRVLYASTWRVQRTPYSLSSGGEGSALWKSTDNGETWTEISTHKGFAKGTLGIIGVTASPVKRDRIWAMVENQKEGGLYRSDDGGESWMMVNNQRSLRQRAWYYTRVYADTQNEDIVYVVNVNYHKSTDGGKTFKASNAPHGDHHDLWIDPNNNQRMIIADDGGAQVSYDGGENWSTYRNQPTAQFYRVTTDNAFPYRIYAAQQDNSTIRIEHRSDGRYITDSNWESTAGGESAHITIDPTDNDIVYGGSYGGFLTRVNHKTGTVRAINVWPDNPMGYGAEGMKYRFQWNFPIIFSRHDPKKLYTFSNHVHLSTNEGQSWEVISPDLTRNDSTKLVSSGGPITQDNTGVEYYCTIFAADESPVEEGHLWVGSDDGLIHLSKDGGENWINITPDQMPEWSMINSIQPSAYDAGTCYVASTRYKMGDFKPYLWKTTNYGESWELITDGIADEHFTRVLREDPSQKNILYAGTESGMYISFDAGVHWQNFQMNLPIVPITDIALKDNNLIVATQGRSLWILDDLTVLHQLQKETSTEELHLFRPKDSYRTKGSGGRSSLTAGTNHPAGVVTHFYVPKEAVKDTLHLLYTTTTGDTLGHFSNYPSESIKKLTLKEGGNTHIWNTRGKGAQRFDGMILWWANLSGAKAVPGTYRVQLSHNGMSQSRLFNIMVDPRAEATVEDMQAQYDFISEINETVDEAHQSIKTTRVVTKKLNSFVKDYGNVSDEEVEALISKAKELIKKLSEVEKALYQTKNRSNQDPLNFPIRLTNKLAHLNSLVSIDDFGPTEQDVAVKTYLKKEIDAQLKKYNALLEDELSAFNAEFTRLGLDFLTP